MKTVLKWTARTVLALLILVGLFLLYANASANKLITKEYQTPQSNFIVQTDSSTLVRGEHLASLLACQDCHGDNFAGRVFVDAPPFRIAAPNLTGGEGSVTSDYNDADWERSIRYSVKPNGKPIAIMPATMYQAISESDMNALVAYLKTVAPVSNNPGPSTFKTLGKIILATGGGDEIFETSMIDFNESFDSPAPAPTKEYGGYLYKIACSVCHRGNLLGGPSPDPEGPAVPPLTAAAQWSDQQLAVLLRDGSRPNGTKLSESMPWKRYGAMTDEEVNALGLFISDTLLK